MPTLAERNRANRAKRKAAEQEAAAKATTRTTTAPKYDGDHSDIADMLQAIPADSTDHDVWMKAGTVCKKYGIPFETFDAWSATDTREGEYLGTEHTRRQWESFDVSSAPSSGWLVSVAKSHGWTSSNRGKGYGWDDEVPTSDWEPPRTDGSTATDTPPTEDNDGKREAQGDNVGNGSTRRLRIVSAADVTGANTPPMTPCIISGVLRRGHKLIISAESKAGKTWMLDGMGIRLATGGKWLDRYKCHRSRVLLVNTEIDAASHANRLEWIRQTWALVPDDYRNTLMTTSLRGERWTVDEFVNEVIAMTGDGFDVVLLDSIYKLFMGNENDNSEVSQMLFAHLDKLCNKGTAVAFVHHNAKNSNARTAIDRASGAGMFARDPDGIITIANCSPNDDQLEYLKTLGYHHGEDYIEAQAQRLEMSLREFGGSRSIPPLVFRCPVHFFDESGELDGVRKAKSNEANGAAGGNVTAEKSKTQIQLCDEWLRERVPEYESFFGSTPTVDGMLAELNRFREDNGMNAWKLGTFKNHLAPGGDLSFVIGKGSTIVPREPKDSVSIDEPSRPE